MKVDNFALEQFVCPAKYYLRIKQGIVPIRRKPSLSFGGAVHVGIAEWYRNMDVPPDVRLAKAVTALHKHWPEVMPSDDFRTQGYALQVLGRYAQEYPSETWKVLRGATEPIVEQPFTLDTGMFVECQNGCIWKEGDEKGICQSCGQALEPIFYGGIIDAGVEFGNMLYVVDHKTTTRLGDGSYYFLQYKPDNQMTGYIWALSKLTNRRVGGAIINAIGLYKSGEVKFKRSITSRNDFEIKEWLQRVRTRCNEIKRCERTNNWILETSRCMDYGECDYRSIHVLNDEVSRQARIEQDYVKSEWDYEQRDD